ncbi:MAG: hypothetical protein Q4B67_00045 [Eubacteriales bacterium]|nr:hypothetical protein [Eubacteriales bacterium]
MKKIKAQLFAAAVTVMVAFLGLASSTYAWYVTQNTVEATTSTISAQAEGAVLQINTGKTTVSTAGAAATYTISEAISPSSTNDLINWFVPENWTENLAKVKTYTKVSLIVDGSGDKDGKYNLGGVDYYAYALGTYTISTIPSTGLADVYFDGSVTGGPIQVTRAGETGIASDKVAASLRVGITIDDRSGSGETLIAVYSPNEPVGKGNDENYDGDPASTNGWRVVKDLGATSNTTTDATYRHLSGNGIGTPAWALTKDSDGQYITPTASHIQLADDVDQNGVIMRVYVWMEGTDADCLGTIVSGDDSFYNVSVYLVGLTVD